MKLLKHKLTGKIRVLGIYGVTEGFDTKELALQDYKRLKRNAAARGRRQAVADICGTSYAEAKRDMGL